MNLKIEEGRFYKTRDRRKVKIYSAEGNKDNKIHGAILEDEGWEEFSWYGKGVSSKEKKSPEDIVDEWGGGIDFEISCLPKWKYIAKDENGIWYVHSKKPVVKIDDISGHWTSGRFSFRLREKDYPKDFHGGWQESLHELGF